MNKVIITLVVVVFIHMGYNFIYKDLGDKNLTKESILICYGDSLTAGYGAPTGRSYPDYLQLQHPRSQLCPYLFHSSLSNRE